MVEEATPIVSLDRSAQEEIVANLMAWGGGNRQPAGLG